MLGPSPRPNNKDVYQCTESIISSLVTENIKKDELMENSSRFVVHLVPFAPISYIHVYFITYSCIFNANLKRTW